MLPITDLNGDTEALTNIRGLTRKRKVNGEKSLAFFVTPDDSNAHSFGMVDVESIVEFKGEEYVIKSVNERNVGLRTIKEVNTVHKFFCDMIDNYKYETYTGSMTFVNALNFIFNNTGYSFVIVDSFTAEQFENFGDDNRLSLLQKILERYGAEFYVEGSQVYFKREIGNNTDFQFRYAHNVKTIDKLIETHNLATYIRGYGKQNEDGSYVVEDEYTSPNAAVLGIKHAPSVRDERYTTLDGLRARLINDLIDEPQMSIKIDFADLRASGYLYAQPNEGDYGFIIYEPMGLDVEARIVEVDEEFDANLNPINTAVTLSNFREGVADILTRFDQTSKQIDRLLEGREQLPYSALDEAVRLATEALQSAQTELEFNNGIIAREKTNPNKLVVFNSAGLGISVDGGSTFDVAMTADGVVAEKIVGGYIIGVNLASINQDGMFHVNGSNAEFFDLNTDRRVAISPDGIFGYNSGGSERFRMDRLLVTSAALGTSNSNVYLAPDASNEARIVDVNGIPSDGAPENYSYRPMRALGYRFGPGANGYIGTDGEVRITSLGFTQVDGSVIYRDLRAANLYGTGFNTTTTNAYIGADNELRVVNKGFVDGSTGEPIYRAVRASGFYGSFIDKGSNDAGIHLYARPASGGEFRTTVRGSTTSFVPIRAEGLITGYTNLYLQGEEIKAVSSGESTWGTGNETYAPVRASEYRNGSSITYKTNIEDLQVSGLAVVNNLVVKQFLHQSDVDNGIYYNWQVGFISELSPEIATPDGKAINLYKALGYAIKAIQEQSDTIQLLEQRISDLEMVV